MVLAFLKTFVLIIISVVALLVGVKLFVIFADAVGEFSDSISEGIKPKKKDAIITISGTLLIISAVALLITISS